VIHESGDFFVNPPPTWYRCRKTSDYLLSYMVGHGGAKSFEVIEQTKNGSSRYTRSLCNDLGRRDFFGFSYEVRSPLFIVE